ncbi:MAG: tetratricopeptide repeat protein [Candidatus Riflebacteria bacterium]|nr:tetratricopeptide repeat protein [Candidatus Riflebacteria bacterium]MBR4571448.1 tetratricopeptide repeat protein [Candidatus Riflebacteria bacterium]
MKSRIKRDINIRFAIAVFFLFVAFFTLYPNFRIYAQDGLNLLQDEEYFKQELKKKPENADLHYNLAIVYKRMGNFSKALDEYKQAVFYKPDDSEAMRELAAIYRMQSNKLQLSEILLKKCLAINPEDCYAWKELAFVQSDLCRSAEAVESLKNSIKYDDSEENLKFSLFYMAILQLNQHKKAEALDTAERLTKIDSDLASQVRVIADMQ